MKRALKKRATPKKVGPSSSLPPIYGPGDWAGKLISHPDLNSTSRIRLLKCIWWLYLNKPLERSDARWVTGILVDVLLGNDLRPQFRMNSAGRSIEPDDHKFWIAVDALVTSEESGIKGKALWGMLAQKWGYTDGSIKNFIGEYRAKAETMLRDVGHDVIRETMHFNVAHYGKAQQSPPIVVRTFSKTPKK